MKSNRFFENEMLFGLYLCTQGEGEIIINEQLCHIRCGDAFVRSPLIVVSNITGNDNFVLETIVEDEIEAIAPIATNNFDLLQKILSHQKYFFSLDRNSQELLLQRKMSIDGYKAELPIAHARRRKAINNIIEILEQLTLLEYIVQIEQYNSPYPDVKRNNTLMIEFVFLLFANYRHHRQVSYYAEALHLSHNHFSRLIKEKSGRTPSEWIALVTINQAKKLLRRKELSIKEVAGELAFPEQFTFRKYFKLHTGISPKEYRLSRS